MNPPIITLTTDFGNKDPFVGMVKGVILGIQPDVTLVDITHEIPPQDIFAGALILHSASRFFPKRTIHLAIVDPGVGSSRRPLLVLSRDQLFLGPDNGIFSFIYEDRPESKIFHITAERYFLKPSGGPTFQGRDLFAPVAAYLAQGLEPGKLGEEIGDYKRLDIPKVRSLEREIRGEVIHVDRFGNLITNITGSLAHDLLRKTGKGKEALTLQIRGLGIKGLHSFYAETAPDTLSILVNSSDWIEIYAFSGNAASLLRAGRGDPVTLFA